MKKVFTHMLIRKKSVGFLPELGGMCLFLFTNFLVHAYERVVSGTLKGKSDQPFQGPMVLVKSTSNDVENTLCTLL